MNFPNLTIGNKSIRSLYIQRASQAHASYGFHGGCPQGRIQVYVYVLF